MPDWLRKRTVTAGHPRRVPYNEAAIRESLRLAIEQALSSMSEAGEQMYGLSVYEGIEHGYICITPFTHEGLERVLAEYRGSEWAEDYLDDAAAEGMRWSAPDSPYHAIETVEAPPLVSAEAQYGLWQGWEQDDAPLQQYRHEVRELCITTLQQMDRESRFGRLRPGFSLMLQDRDERESAEEIEAIRMRLNPI